MKSALLVVGYLLAVSSSGSLSAQSYIPLPPLDPMSELVTRSDPARSMSSETDSSVNLTGDSLSCANPPAVNNLNALTITNNSMDITTASQLNFPVVSIAANGTGRVLVQDWSRTATCIARDGQTELVYGQALRVIATSDQIDADVALTLPIIAANTTLNRRASNIQAQVLGFNNAVMLQKASQVLGPIDVSNFGSLNTIVQDLAKLAPTASGGSVVRLGINNPPVPASSFVISAYAVQQVADGKSCQDAKNRFTGLNAAQSGLIDAIYSEFSTPCSAVVPNSVSRAQANVALLGVRVRK